jgi:serine protease AprX
MNRWTLRIILAALVIVTGTAVAARIEPNLLRTLATADPNRKFPVDFYLKAQANAMALDASIADLPRSERRARVGRVLMGFADGTQQNLLEYLKARQAEGKVDGINPLWIVNSIGCRATRDVILEVAQRSDVELIYYDRMPCELGSLELKGPRAVTDGVPPNTVLTNVRGAWNQGYHGEGIVLGVVDTGVWYTHLDLRNHLWTSSAYPHCGFNFASYQCNPPGPSPFDTLTPLGYYGPGTNAAGIATADGAYGQGIHETLGIAPAARIMSAEVGTQSPSPDALLENSILAGIQFCVRPPRDTLNGADVITTSLGFIAAWSPRLAVWRVAEENVLAAGLVNTLAAGNEGPSGRDIRCPGCCPPPWPNPANHPTSRAASAAITVGATDNNDNLAFFSSTGPTDVWDSIPPWFDYAYPPGLTDPDVVMPGVNILSTYAGSDTLTGDTAYTTMSGTSMSTAAAAGAVCLMLSKNPHLTPREIDSIIELYAVRDLGLTGKDNTYGAGRIDCSLAVARTPVSIIGVRDAREPTASSLRLSAFPNPFHDHVSLQLSANSLRQEIRIFDIRGALVREFVIPQFAFRNPQCLTWDGRDEAARRVAEGCYFVTLKAGGGTAMTKVVMSRQ